MESTLHRPITPEVLERRRCDYMDAIQPFAREMTHLSLMHRLPKVTLDDHGNVMQMEYVWTSDTAKECYNAYENIVRLLYKIIVGEEIPYGSAS